MKNKTRTSVQSVAEILRTQTSVHQLRKFWEHTRLLSQQQKFLENRRLFRQLLKFLDASVALAVPIGTSKENIGMQPLNFCKASFLQVCYIVVIFISHIWRRIKATVSIFCIFCTYVSKN